MTGVADLQSGKIFEVAVYGLRETTQQQRLVCGGDLCLRLLCNSGPGDCLIRGLDVEQIDNADLGLIRWVDDGIGAHARAFR